MNKSLGITVIIFLSLLIFEVTLYLIVRKTHKLKIKKKDIFPNISLNLISKFNSFDRGLGWVNKPNTIKNDSVGDTQVTYTYDKNGSRLSEVKNIVKRNNNLSISTYGDSFCQCREVNDDETWQHYLGEEIGIKIQNFGVGNYGIDQSLMRLKKEYGINKTDIVILEMVPLTITRITSVWKHFSEPFNLLNFKPRYKLKDAILKYIENPIQEKQHIHDSKKYRKYVLKHDEHFNYFKSHIFSFPFTFSMVRKPSLFLSKAIYPRLPKIFPFLDIKALTQYLSDKHELAYRIKCYKEYSLLLEKIVDEFVNYSIEQSFVPILLIQPQMDDLLYIKYKNEAYYRATIERLKSKLLVVDATKELISYNGYENLYVYGFRGGHHSPKGNKVIANFLNEELIKSKVL